MSDCRPSRLPEDGPGQDPGSACAAAGRRNGEDILDADTNPMNVSIMCSHPLLDTPPFLRIVQKRLLSMVTVVNVARRDRYLLHWGASRSRASCSREPSCSERGPATMTYQRTAPSDGFPSRNELVISCTAARTASVAIRNDIVNALHRVGQNTGKLVPNRSPRTNSNREPSYADEVIHPRLGDISVT